MKADDGDSSVLLPGGTNSARGGSVSEMERRAALRRMPRVARVLALLLAFAVVTHTALIATWVAPNNQIRQTIGASSLRAYVLPVFEQNWSIFAPNPRRTAVALEVRARIEDPQTGERSVTEWVDLVALEEAMIPGNPLAPRMSNASRRVADRLHSAVSNMNDEQRDWLQANYLTTPIEQLRTRLTDVEGDSPASATQIDNYLIADRAAAALATAHAKHTAGGEVIHVQYRSSTRPVPSYTNREDQTVDDTARNERDYGWRAPVDLTDQDLEFYGRYLDQIDPS